MTWLKLSVLKKLLQRKQVYYGYIALLLCCSISTLWYFSLAKEFSKIIIREPTKQELPGHTLCVLVPFRDAYEELLEFIPFMNAFLNRQSIRFHFIVVNHVQDGNRFNKGTAFNAGFEIILKQYTDCDYLALHDIDLLPLNDEITYEYPGDDVYNAANPAYHPLGYLYDPNRYVGGISLISNKQYSRINGFGNNFWGWGGEDRNFYYRMSNNSIIRRRPNNLTTDKTNTFRNIHSLNRRRDYVICNANVKTKFIEYDFESGLSDVKYQLISVLSLKIDNVPLSFFSISVPCNFTQTPWCKPACLNNVNLNEANSEFVQKVL